MIASPAHSMDLSDLLEGMDLVVPSLAVTDITTNSRHAVRDGLFLARAGLQPHTTA